MTLGKDEFLFNYESFVLRFQLRVQMKFLPFDL